MPSWKISDGGALSPRVDRMGAYCNCLRERSKVKVVAVEKLMIREVEYGVGATE